MVQLSHPYMTTGKTVALTIQIFLCKVMTLLFNMFSRFVIVFLPRIKCLLISWLQSNHSDFRVQESKVFFYFLHIYLPRNDGTGCHDLSFLNVKVFSFFFFLLSVCLCFATGIFILTQLVNKQSENWWISIRMKANKHPVLVSVSLAWLSVSACSQVMHQRNPLLTDVLYPKQNHGRQG